MTPHSVFYFMPSEHQIAVHNIDTTLIVGRIGIEGPKHYSVRDGDGITVGTFDYLEEAANALMKHYEKHSLWRSENPTQYFKWTLFGEIDVTLEDGSWYVNRNGEQPLERDGEIVKFATLEEAQRAADLHVCDPLTRGPLGDGLSWYVLDKFRWWTPVRTRDAQSSELLNRM